MLKKETPINETTQLEPSTPKRPWIQVIIIGQLISFLLTGTSVFTFMLVNHLPVTANKTKCELSCNTDEECQGINIPVLQSIFTYILLACHMILRCRCKNSRRQNIITTTTTTTRTRQPSRNRPYYSIDKMFRGSNDEEIDDAIAQEIDNDIGRASRSSSVKTDSDSLLLENNKRPRSTSNMSLSTDSSTLSSSHPITFSSSSSSQVFPPWCCLNCQTCSVSLWSYLLVSMADVFANYLMVKAFQDTSLTSAMLLDCFALPCCALLSYLFLGVRYSKRHLFGVLLCVIGLVLNVVSDTMMRTNHSSNPLSNTSSLSSSSTSL